MSINMVNIVNRQKKISLIFFQGKSVEQAKHWRVRMQNELQNACLGMPLSQRLFSPLD